MSERLDIAKIEITKEMIAAARWEFPSPIEFDYEDEEAFRRMIRAILKAASKTN